MSEEEKNYMLTRFMNKCFYHACSGIYFGLDAGISIGLGSMLASTGIAIGVRIVHAILNKQQSCCVKF